ncbi:type IV secretion system protein VirD4 [Herbaspirillum seropedicae]|uniref:type IV secretory system conjugative DNA transfer family protein n=1 Tax=Herbaspirillum seropedicae TaxID=964 RepID=UPI003399778A
MKHKINNAAGPQIRAASHTRAILLPLLGAVAVLAGLQISTQLFAHWFGYQEVLGAHLGHVYAPWAILQWAHSWRDQFPDELTRAGSIGMVTTVMGLVGVALAKVVTSNTAKADEYLHGSARWADRKDIQAAGLLPRERNFLEIVTGKAPPTTSGVYVGGWQDKKGRFFYLRHSGPEHVLTYAPTRSGKGVGLVVPTLLSWGASTVITDLKGELWALTAGWRQQHAHNKVLRFEPASASGSVCWNPLDEVRLGTEHEVGDVQNLATLIVDPDGKGLDSHWQKTSFALLVGVILHALYLARDTGETATLPSIDAMLSAPNRDIGRLWAEMATYGHVLGQNHHAVGSAARDMMDRPEEEAGSVLSTAKSYLSLYRDPVVARNVSRSDFHIKQLMHEDAPVSLYLVTQPNDKARLRPLVRIMVNMIVRLLADRMDFKEGRPVAHYKHRLLMMLDEFPSLGKLEIMQESLAFVAGYGIKCYLICQDLNQLRSRETGYGPDESITSNCHVQNAYPPNRIETAEHLSRLSGQTTVVKEQITTSGRRTAVVMGQVSRTMQEVQRPLLTPDECLRMPGPRKNAAGEIEQAGDMVIYVAGYPAIYGKQPLYFKDPIFQARAAIAAPAVSDRLNAAPPAESEQSDSKS